MSLCQMYFTISCNITYYSIGNQFPWQLRFNISCNITYNVLRHRKPDFHGN